MMKNYAQMMVEQAQAEMDRFAKKQKQQFVQDTYIGYFKRIVGTAKYRTHKYR